MLFSWMLYIGNASVSVRDRFHTRPASWYRCLAGELLKPGEGFAVILESFGATPVHGGQGRQAWGPAKWLRRRKGAGARTQAALVYSRAGVLKGGGSKCQVFG